MQETPQMPETVAKFAAPSGQIRLSPGERLKILRGRARVNRPQLAEWAQVSRSALSRYEADQGALPLDKAARIAATLGTTTDYLAGLTDDPDPPDPDEPTRVWLNLVPLMAV
jgi:transcriptional regulator with XRE-family HTH domain